MDKYELASAIRKLIPHASGAVRAHLEQARDLAAGVADRGLSDADIEKLPAGGELPDRACAGLIVKRTARAGVVWYLRRRAAGKDKLYRIATWPETSAEAARALWGRIKNQELSLGQAVAHAAQKQAVSGAGPVLLSTAIRRYVDFAEANRSGSTARQAKGNLGKFLKAFGDTPIEGLTASLVHDALIDIENERGPEAAKKTRDALSRLWQFGQGSLPGARTKTADRFIQLDLPNPVAGVHYQQRPPKEPLSPQEIDALWTNIYYCRGLREVVRGAVMLAAITGARIGEACMIETAWVNDTDGWIELPAGATKNREAHRLVITGDVRGIIDSHRRDGARWLFGVERGGKVAPLDPRSVNNEFRNSLKQLGVYREGKAAREQPSPHRMRASAYTWMIEQGIDQRVVDRAFNHKPTGLRRTYGWSAELWEEVKKAVNAWQFRLADSMIGRSPRARR